MLERLTIEPESPARCTVIWMHGLGADGHDFEPLIRDWGLVEELRMRFILPHAPYRPVTLNQGMVMRAWYDLHDLSFAKGEDRDGIESATRAVGELIEKEVRRGISASKILLAGFSQGGALALHTALRCEHPLAGVLALSSYLPLGHLLGEQARAPSSLAIRMDHGDSDSVVPFPAAERARRVLEEQGYAVEFHTYSMGHSLCPEQTRNLRSWIVDRLANRTPLLDADQSNSGC